MLKMRKDIRAAQEEGRKLANGMFSPEAKAKRLQEQAQELKAKFIVRASIAGFSREMAEFLYENFALDQHEHWDGRLD